LKDLKEIDLQETEEQKKHHEIERIGYKDPSKFRKSDTNPHRREDHQKENKITFPKQFKLPYENDRKTSQ